TQRGLEALRYSVLVGGDVVQLDGGSPLHLLAEGPGEALERTLGDPLLDRAGLVRGGAQDHHAAARGDAADDRVEELEHLLEVLGAADAGGVEDEPRELAVGVRAGELVVRFEDGADGLDQATLATDEDGAVQRRLAGLVAAELLGLGEADLPGDERPRRGGHEL